MTRYLSWEGPPEVASFSSLLSSKPAWLDWVTQRHIQLSWTPAGWRPHGLSEQPVLVFAHPYGKNLLVSDELASRNCSLASSPLLCEPEHKPKLLLYCSSCQTACFSSQRRTLLRLMYLKKIRSLVVVLCASEKEDTFSPSWFCFNNWLSVFHRILLQGERKPETLVTIRQLFL